MLNKVQIIGNLGGDPESRQINDGTTVTNFTVATTERWKSRDGEQQERTEWHKVVVWGKLAEICSQYLHKGKQVYLEGSLQTRQWEDKDGQKRYTTEIKAFEMKMLGGRGGESAPAVKDIPSEVKDVARKLNAKVVTDDDLPF